MADLIDRKATYYILTEYYHHKTQMQHAALIDALGKVPTVSTEERWIPCSERLPDKYDSYIVTVKREDGTKSVTTRFYTTLHGFERFDNETVIAWMQYPEEYSREE